ncbi:response regulator transcription factor [Hymenobacter sp. RP-2-7]|uniref:Response regulator transcription factor n=1 Tax=Hymenobacter polaris TaxID=2682546 RepID=A0A7Y0FM92_9BACT|nr:response regulator transcription factor [Hymenobacter polaris]NML65266.1 response regulator transcription factor [Hymenobacter polaris]
MTRIFLVDDHAVLRSGLRTLLGQEANVQIVGEATNGQELLDQLPTKPADVVLLDINMPVLDGVATARRLRTEFPQVRVLMLSMIDQPLRIGQAFAAGANGYILKNAERAEIMVGISMVLAGKRFLCSEIGLSLLDTVLTAELRPPVPSAVSPLSRREQEVLQLVAEGLTTHQIAELLFTSKRTIETHRQNILEKTGAKNTAALIRYAIAQGFLPAEGSGGA